ncbi:hypothetical protein Cgig2_027839 [Carnegiea gigantea]|uniref:protein S-acyltransferase n=1 Tax=Carnegiea gigantea TaxID=171969 RepID=A0A9Q1K0Q8_9CARY|nr:hypothetical protein Cgig2_027839 [Carnegiea gigantea]
MSSEIEVVDEAAEPRDRDASASTSASTSTLPRSEESLRDDVYTAAAYGDMEKLQRLVERQGCSVSEPDGLGYYALQWAALNNRTAAARYILEHGGDVNAADHTGQTALHWSAVRGAIQVAELVLQEGARVNAADMYGYQATHVAAQYGQTAFLYHIVTKWNADPDVPDNDGRSPLHWAAYKGFADCIRLLLFLDAYRGRQDKEGCTPLHWAAIRGNLEACTVLVQAGKKEDLIVADNTGLTPAQLAADKHHRQVAFFLGNARRLLDRRWDENSWLGKLAKLGLAPILWFIILLLLVLYIHSVILDSELPRLTMGFGLLAWLGVFLASAGLVMFYRCSRKDPGFIKRNVRDAERVKDDEPLLNINIDNPALLAGNWSQLCITCKKNKWEFFLFLLLEVAAMLITGLVALIRVVTDPIAPSSFGAWLNNAGNHHSGAISFLVADIFLFFGVAVLTVVQASQISHNVTTNEMANAMRYGYLRGPGGRFRNPYDRGIRKNCSGFFMKGYNEDVECVEESAHDEGIRMVQMASNPSLQNGLVHSHQTNGNGHVAINVNPKGAHGHGHSHCNHHHGHGRTSAPVGLGLGLGRSSSRSVAAS